MVVFVFSLICYLVLIGYLSHHHAVVVLWYHGATFVTNNHLYHDMNWIYKVKKEKNVCVVVVVALSWYRALLTSSVQ